MHKHNYPIITKGVLAQVKFGYIELWVHEYRADQLSTLVTQGHVRKKKSSIYALLPDKLDKALPLIICRLNIIVMAPCIIEL